MEERLMRKDLILKNQPLEPEPEDYGAKEAIEAQFLEVSDLPPPPPERPVNVDAVRRNIAYTSMAFFGITLLFLFISALVGGEAWNRTVAVAQIAVPIETLLIGATAGHYLPTRN